MQPSWRLRAPTDVEDTKGVQAPEVILRISERTKARHSRQPCLLDALDDGNDSAPTHRPCTLRRRWKSIFKQGGLADHGSGGDVFWAAFGLWDNCRSQIGWLAGHRQLCIRTHETTTLLDGGKRSRWWGVPSVYVNVGQPGRCGHGAGLKPPRVGRAQQAHGLEPQARRARLACAMARAERRG